MGKAHSNAFRQVGRYFPSKLTVRMKGLCGRDRAACESAARQLAWEEVETDWRRVVERKDIDVVDIAAPGNLHYAMAVAAAEAKKHIISEKPLANSLAQAKEMLRTVERSGVKHTVTHKKM